MEDQGARYQICGPNAFNRYGFDEQVPTRIYAYNNRHFFSQIWQHLRSAYSYPRLDSHIRE
jgi:hypothetical protein